MNNQGEEWVLKLNEAKSSLPKVAAEDVLVVARDKIKMTKKTFSSFSSNLASDTKLKKLALDYNTEYARLKAVLENIDKVNLQADPTTMEFASETVNTDKQSEEVSKATDKLSGLLVQINAGVDRISVKSGFQVRAIKTPPLVPKTLYKIYRYFKERSIEKEMKQHFKEEIKNSLQNPDYVMPVIKFDNYEVSLMREKQLEINANKEVNERIDSENIEFALQDVAAKKLGIPSKEVHSAAIDGMGKSDDISKAFLSLAVQKINGTPTVEEVRTAENGIEESKRILANPDLSIEAGMLSLAKVKHARKVNANAIDKKREKLREEANNISAAHRYLSVLIDERDYNLENGFPDIARKIDDYIKNQKAELSDLMEVDFNLDIVAEPETEKQVEAENSDVEIDKSAEYLKRQEDLEYAFNRPSADEWFKVREEFKHFKALESSIVESGLPATAEEVLDSVNNDTYMNEVYGDSKGNDHLILDDSKRDSDFVSVSSAMLGRMVNGLDKKTLSDKNIPLDFLQQRLFDAKGKGDINITPDLLESLLREYLDRKEKMGSTVVPENVKRDRIREARKHEKVPKAVLDKSVSDYVAKDPGTRQIPLAVLNESIASQIEREREALLKIEEAETEYQESIKSDEQKMEQDIAAFVDAKRAEHERLIEEERKELSDKIDKIRKMVDPDGLMSDEEFNTWLEKQRNDVRNNTSLSKAKQSIVDSVIMLDAQQHNQKEALAKVNASLSKPDAEVKPLEVVQPIVIPEVKPVEVEPVATVQEVPVVTPKVKIVEVEQPTVDIQPIVTTEVKPVEVEPVTSVQDVATPEFKPEVQHTFGGAALTDFEARYSKVVDASKPVKAQLKIVDSFRKANRMKNAYLRNGISVATTPDLLAYATVMNQKYSDDPIIQAQRMAIQDELMNSDDENYTKKNQEYMDNIFNNPENKAMLDQAEYNTDWVFGSSSVTKETPEEKRAYVEKLQQIKDLQKEYNNAFVYAGEQPVDTTAAPVKTR